MKRKSLNISRKIEPEKAEAIIAVKAIADRCGIPIFIIGAAARDLVIEYAFGVTTIRATSDIDFGIMVQSWEQFAELVKQLIGSGEIDKTEQHRFLFRKYQLIDIIPFGPIVDKGKSIRWPGSESREMNMTGYEEAFQNAVEVQIQEEPPVSIKMADPTCLAIMKLLSWQERYPERDKDAKDFHFIMVHYLDFDKHEYAYECHSDLMDLPDFDYETTGARILGRDIAAVASPITKEKIEKILLRETYQSGSYRLLQDMDGITYSDEIFEKNIGYLEQVKIGFLERKMQQADAAAGYREVG